MDDANEIQALQTFEFLELAITISNFRIPQRHQIKSVNLDQVKV